MSFLRKHRRATISTVSAAHGVALVLAATLPQIGLAQGYDGEPTWSYGVAPPPIDPSTVFELPGSGRSFTHGEIRDPFGPADWYPDSHPTMPDIVANGSYPDVWACALCHYPNGQGRPENGPIAGLPKDYFIQQMQAFRNGERKSAQPRKFNTHLMTTIAQGMTDEQVEQAAEYYSSMPWRQWIRVVETEEVPKSRFSLGMYIPLEGEAAGTEPLGMRIMETPENVEHAEVLRDPTSGFIAYVPVGSVAKGEELVTSGGNGKTIACNICHGPDLNGLGIMPGIVGRSPTYIVRQMYDMREGTRRGAQTALMQPTVANLTTEDMINIAAYVASLPVEAPSE